MATTAETKLTKQIWDEAALEALPEDGYIHEVVDGDLVMSPKNNFEHGDICARLLTALMGHIVEHKLGVVVDSSTGFWMRNRNCRAPDISFIAKERLRGLKHPPREFFEGAPDLAVEVISPSNSSTEINDRLKDFFESGTRLAWVIHPVERFVEICTSSTTRQLVSERGILDGGDVVPGFSYEIAKLFEPWDWD
jgi:Uma2 family endonuclease